MSKLDDLIWTFATLRVGNPFVFFFRENLQILQPEPEIAIILERLKIETRHLELTWGTNFGCNRSRNTGFRAKKLKCQSEVQTALARKLIAQGE